MQADDCAVGADCADPPEDCAGGEASIRTGPARAAGVGVGVGTGVAAGSGVDFGLRRTATAAGFITFTVWRSGLL